MIVHFPLLLLAAALIWFPRQWMRFGLVFSKRRRRRVEGEAPEPWKAREPGDPRLSFRSEFRKPRNYLDLLRATAGSVALSGGMGIPASVSHGADVSRAVVWQVIIVRAAILGVGLLIQ